MLTTLKANSPELMPGGMATGRGLLSTLRENAKSRSLAYEIKSHGDAVFSGSLGAAILGGFRYEKLEEGMWIEASASSDGTFKEAFST